MVDPARVLVVNDDGIEAPGIKALVARLVREGLDVRVVAPAVEQSAKSGAMTVHGVLEAEVHAYAEAALRSVCAWKVYGTPVDCIKLAVCELLQKMDFVPDLVLSGINRGNNAGLNPLCSGTVGAALAAKTHGLNSVALSLDHPATYVSGEPHALDQWNYDMAAEVTMPIVRDILHHRPLEGVVLNVNIPNVPEAAMIRGFRRTRQGWSSWNDWFKEVVPVTGNPPGRRAYQIHGSVNMVDESDHFDTFAIREGFVAITPLGIHFDPSHYDDYRLAHEQLNTWSIFQPHTDND